MVYSDYQRLELEKEYCTSRYITIRRKTELAATLQLSERQVKIWFQNRRAKERKQTKKNNEQAQAQALTVQQVQQHVQHSQHLQHHSQHPDLSYMDTKLKLEPGLHHLQHPNLHQMGSMAMSMAPINLHHLHGHHSLALAHSGSHSHAHPHSQHTAHHTQLSPNAAGTIPM